MEETCCQGAPVLRALAAAHAPAAAAPVERETVLEVEGATCGACVLRIETALREVPGVTAVAFNLASRRARVTHGEGVALEGLEEARRLYVGDSRKVSCATCHGAKGDGRGEMADQFDPRPRNVPCAQTVNGIPDGQLFWIIRTGSPGTSMPPHPALSDRQVWSIVNYLRQLAR